MSMGYKTALCRNQTGSQRNDYDVTKHHGLGKRKEAARKYLMENLHSRFNDVKHSGHIFIGEVSKHETKLPRVISHGTECPKSISHHSRVPSSPGVVSMNANVDVDDETENNDLLQIRNKSSTSIRKTDSNNLSLPEIIMAFNSEASMAVSESHNFVRSPTDFSEDDRVLGAPYEDYLKVKKYGRYNPCKGKYRPVTPGLLDTLNKQRMPSKVKTEQWLRSTQYLPKATYCNIEYQTHVCLDHPNWIYTDS
ncbi:hypothetical protein DPMN_134007 [Dreissena polymorpha]|uniref:Uncharacterized protein n=1 Tax=Dreissena polymorpha TaxID=45954 RepID=A0A9D4JBJ1_DREPO|nr:hypothetical protein DPMN_163517 [Dreissena polymorpha]KAH3805700.1 hypothetical protein DPMN_134007 [Dreissena polymorpha]